MPGILAPAPRLGSCPPRACNCGSGRRCWRARASEGGQPDRRLRGHPWTAPGFSGDSRNLPSGRGGAGQWGGDAGRRVVSGGRIRRIPGVWRGAPADPQLCRGGGRGGGGALPFRSLIWAGPRRDRERRTGPEGERESSDPRLSRERAGSAPY